ncbi:MAG TPA: helix-turn-helix domain-containing protein [Anaerolineales bacterium]|nr:helix-turn-helix domain-containing protein [Anaerolineales bacterium]
MDRKEYGTLIAMLREDMDWTQFQLAEYAGMDVAVISQIERGVKKHMDADLLFQLANSFHLTTIERREFFLASSGVNEKRIIRQPSAALATDTIDADKVLKKMINIIEQLRLPAFIMDVYSDILAANFMAVTFFQVPPEMFANATLIPGGFSSVRMMFGKELAVRSKIQDNWDRYAIGSMQFVRENSLRYRAKPYFQYLMKAFRNPTEYPLFDRYWKQVSSFEQDREANVDIFSYTHADFGRVNYATSTTVSITSYGELFLNQYLPLDDHTRNLFEKIANDSGYGVLAPLAPWPVNNMP